MTWIAIGLLALWCTALMYLVCFRIRDGQTHFIDPIRRHLWGETPEMLERRKLYEEAPAVRERLGRFYGRRLQLHASA